MLVVALVARGGPGPRILGGLAVLRVVLAASPMGARATGAELAGCAQRRAAGSALAGSGHLQLRRAAVDAPVRPARTDSDTPSA